MFDNPKKELEKLEQQLLDDEEWFQQELESAKRMIGQAPEKAKRPTGPHHPQVSGTGAKAAPAAKSAPTSGKEPVRQSGKKKTGKKKSGKKAKKSNKGLITLAIVEALGILGLAAYWLLVLLK